MEHHLDIAIFAFLLALLCYCGMLVSMLREIKTLKQHNHPQNKIEGAFFDYSERVFKTMLFEFSLVFVVLLGIVIKVLL